MRKDVLEGAIQFLSSVLEKTSIKTTVDAGGGHPKYVTNVTAFGAGQRAKITDCIFDYICEYREAVDELLKLYPTKTNE